MSVNNKKFSIRDKKTFNLVFNSSLKRHIIGIYFLILKRVLRNTSFNSISFNEFLKESGPKGILTKEYLKKSLKNEADYNTLDLLIAYKIIKPLNPSTLVYDFLSLEEIIESADKHQFANGIEFDEDLLKTSSGGLAVSLHSLNLILNNWLEQKIQQTKIQKAIDELHTVPSRKNPHLFHYFLVPVDSKNNPGVTKKKGNIYYSLTDEVIDFLDKFHPVPDEEVDDVNGELFLKLIDLSIKLEIITKNLEDMLEKSKKFLKILDSEIFHKSILLLSENILNRELIIRSLEDLVKDKSRSEIFQQKIRFLTDQGSIAWQIVKEAEMTSKSLPKAFEHVEELETPVGSVGNWMVAFSRLIVCYLINKGVKKSLEGTNGLFQSEIGTTIMIELFNWSQNDFNLALIDQIQDLLMEAKSLVDFYPEEQIRTINKEYNEI